MTERTIIPRRGQDAVVEGIPEMCPACRSIDIRTEHGEWCCNRCREHSLGWMSRPSTPRQEEKPDYELVGDLDWWAREHHGAAPTEEDWTHSAPHGAEPTSAYIARFGSWSAALERAGLEHSGSGVTTQRRTSVRYTNDELVATIKKHAVTLGRTPSERDWVSARPADAATIVTYRTRFGSWPAALEAAGLEPNPNSLHRSQPAPAPVDPAAAALAETAAAAPASTPIEASEVGAPETPHVQGVVEQPLPPTYAQTPVRLVARPVTRVPDLLPDTEPDWREQAKRRYIDALLGCVENWDGDEYFALCDRVERLLFGGES